MTLYEYPQTQGAPRALGLPSVAAKTIGALRPSARRRQLELVFVGLLLIVLVANTSVPGPSPAFPAR